MYLKRVCDIVQTIKRILKTTFAYVNFVFKKILVFSK